MGWPLAFVLIVGILVIGVIIALAIWRDTVSHTIGAVTGVMKELENLDD